MTLITESSVDFVGVDSLLGGRGIFNNIDVYMLGELPVPLVTNILTEPIRPQGSLVYDLNSDIIYYSNGHAWATLSNTSLPSPLQSIAGLTTLGGEMLYTTGANTYALSNITLQGRNVLATSNQMDAQSVLGVVIGTDVQAYTSGLSSFASIVSSAGANELVYNVAPNTFSITSFTPAARQLLGDSSFPDMRTTLDVVQGAASSTNNAIAKWSGTSGDVLVNTGVTLDASNNLVGVQNFDGISPAMRGQLANIGATTISAAQWAYLGDSNQSVSTSGDVVFNTMQSTLDTTVGGDILLTGNLDSITPAIRNQLANIHSTTISTTQWGYLGVTDQGLATTSDVVFNTMESTAGATVGGNLTVIGNLDSITPAMRTQLANIGGTTINTAQWGYVGSMDQAVATTDTPTFSGLKCKQSAHHKCLDAIYSSRRC